MERINIAYVFGLSTAVATLLGCAGPQAPIGTSIPTQSASAVIEHGGLGTSWMLGEAKNQQLLYASDAEGKVFVYTFPGGKLVGTLTGVSRPAGMCTDRNGNVWITSFVSGGKMTEYAHAGTEPIATLNTSDTLTPQDCSVDRASGNLAVVGYGPEKPNVLGRILIYSKASGRPKTYKVSFGETSYCSYDDKGNLFIDGFGYQERPSFVAAELPKGAAAFTQINFSPEQPAESPSPVQWDGKYITFGSNASIVRYTVHKNLATEVGSTGLYIDGITDAWIEGGKIVATDPPHSPPVKIFNYPAGGNSIKDIDSYAFGVTVSAAN